MRSYRAIGVWLLAAALTGLAAGCGGGRENQSPAASPEGAVAALRTQAQALAAAGAITPQQAAEQLMDFGEAHFAQYFPTHKSTALIGPFAYRFYNETGIYLGVVVAPDGIQYQLEDVYVMGGPFGSAPKFVAPLSAIITPVGPPSCNDTSNAAVTVSPCSLSATYDELNALPLALPVDVTPNIAFDGTVFVRVLDPQGIVSDFVDLRSNGRGGVTATLHTIVNQDFGVYEGAVSVQLCRDANCAAQFQGSPLTLPYRFTVRRSDPSVNLSSRPSGPIGGPGRTVPLTLGTNRLPLAGFFVQCTDDQGLGRVSSTIPVSSNNHGFPTSVDFDVPVSLPDTPGTYKGSFTATVCRDAACSLPVSGSARSFGYSFFVEAKGISDAALNATPVLTPLQPLPGAGDWAAVGGNAARTGYVPGSFDPSRFTLRWKWPLPSGKSYALTQPAASSGRIAVAAKSLGGSSDTALFVLDESTGALRWQLDGGFTRGVSFSAPALTSTTLYTVTNEGTSATLRGYDAAAGSVVFATPVTSNNLNGLPPSIANNAVLMAAGASAGVGRFSLAGQQQWLTEVPGFNYWLPSSQGNTVYQYGSGTMNWLDAASGSLIGSASDTGWNSALGLTFVSQVTTIGDAGMAFVVDRGIIAFDRTSRSVAWSDHSSTLASVRAAAAQGGMLILLRQSPLLVEARRQSDGAVLWSYAPSFGPPTGFTIQQFLSDPILTDNLVFVSTHQGVFAIDRRSGTPRWFFGVPGSLAITPSGTLLISDPSRADLGGGSVTAVNLR